MNDRAHTGITKCIILTPTPLKNRESYVTNRMRPTSIKLDINTKGRIKQLADSRDRTAHWVIQQAIQQYLDREGKRDQLRKETITAWNDYQETGLHVTADEVSDWLDTWGTDKEAKVPVCHK